MGRKHRQTVITKNGEAKIQQYGAKGGNPSVQGILILEYLKNGDLDKYQRNLETIPLITEEQCKEIEEDPNWSKNYHYLSTYCGAKIHRMIEDGEVKFVSHIDDEGAKKWCEGFYTIDFEKEEFTSEFHDKKQTFKLNSLPTIEEYLKIMEPVKLKEPMIWFL